MPLSAIVADDVAASSASITTAVPVGLAVVDREDLVGRVVVHDAVETILAGVDLLDQRQRLQVEHRRRRVAAVGREAVAGASARTRCRARAACPDVAEDLAGRAVDDHDVRAARDEHAARRRIGGEVVGAASPPMLYFSTLYVCENAALGAAMVQASAVASANTDFLPML